MARVCTRRKAPARAARRTTRTPSAHRQPLRGVLFKLLRMAELTAQDVYLFREGTLLRAYRHLGAHLQTVSGNINAELQSLVPGPDRQLEAVEALGWTASRQAIPILLDQLEHTDPLTSDRADESLRMLTHRIPAADSDNRDQRARYLQWSKWWQREGKSATIFKPHDCGIERPLQP